MRIGTLCTIVTALGLAACATGPRTPELATADAPSAEDGRAACERTIYRTNDYDASTALRCAQLLDVWN